MDVEHQTPVYRVVANGTHVQPLAHVRSTGNGWHRFRVLQPDPMAGTEFTTRSWYPHTTPMSAVLAEMEYSFLRMRTLAACFAYTKKRSPRWHDLYAEMDVERKHFAALRMQAEMTRKEAHR